MWYYIYSWWYRYCGHCYEIVPKKEPYFEYQDKWICSKCLIRCREKFED